MRAKPYVTSPPHVGHPASWRVSTGKSVERTGPRGGSPKIRRTTMTQEKMNQVQIDAIELTDDQLEMVTGGKGRPGGGSLIRDGWRLIRRLIEKVTEPNS